MFANISLILSDATDNVDGLCSFCEEVGVARLAKFDAILTYSYKDGNGGQTLCNYEVCAQHLIALTENFRDMDR